MALAVAGAVNAGGRRWTAAGQDVGVASAPPLRSGLGIRAGDAARPGHALDRTGHGDGRRSVSAPRSASGAPSAYSRTGSFSSNYPMIRCSPTRCAKSSLPTSPATHAAICVDEKSQIQALRHTQTGLPLAKGRCGTMTHAYVRNGTTVLFVALSVLEGGVIDRYMHYLRQQELIRFLNAIEAKIPAGKLLHVVIDKYATHSPRRSLAWLDRRSRWMFQCTVTSASSLNAVEGFFATPAKRRVNRGVFHSLVSHQAALSPFVADTSTNRHPFRWGKDPKKIIAAVKHEHQALDSIRQQLAKPHGQKTAYLKSIYRTSQITI